MSALPQLVDLGIERPSRIFATVGGLHFRTQEQLRRHAQGLFEKYQDGEFAEAADAWFLLQLLARHPDAERKIGPGVLLFQRRTNQFRDTIPAPGWWLIRVDGEERAFSIYDCLRDQPASEEERFLQDVLAACRGAINDRMHQVKLDHFQGRKMARCQESGTQIAFSEAQVDHAGEWPFIRIADEWLKERAPYFWQITIQKKPGGGTWFADKLIDQDFLEFHDQRATLRVVHRSVNMASGSAGYRLTFVIPSRSGQAA